MNELRNEQATPDDTANIASIIGRLLRELLQSIGLKALYFNASEPVQLLRSFRDRERYVAFVARDSDAGLVAVITSVEGNAPYAGRLLCTILDIYVELGWGGDSVFEGGSVSRSLAPPLPQSARTLAFYEHQGFAVIGRRKLKLEVSA